MNKLLLILGVILPCGPFLLARQAVSDLPQRVDAGGHLLRMRVAGHGSPTVVLEIGLGGVLEEWAAVQPRVATFTRVVAYDRVGSHHAQSMLTGTEIAHELHRALEYAGIEPPYILVGQSFGGVYNRVFASLYPDEVVGMLLLDPSQEEFIDWMTTHHPDRQISQKDTIGWPEGAGIWATLAELKQLGPLPNVPTVVVTGARPSDDPIRIEVLPVWTSSHADWVKTLSQGRHVQAPESGHGVHVEAADRVVALLHDMVAAARSVQTNQHPSNTESDTVP